MEDVWALSRAGWLVAELAHMHLLFWKVLYMYTKYTLVALFH